MMQSWALLVDSYRLLISRKLFWFTLAISALVVLGYASIGFSPTGITFFFGLLDFDHPTFRAGEPAAEILYLGLFTHLIVDYWLTWGAIILALISTSPIFVDLIAEGSIDLVLSKPIHRVRIFLVRYLGGLLFVLVQMTVFCTATFICVGLRIDQWKWEIFLAIPIVVLFFSYLYAVNVLIAIWSRSTMVALLVTSMFWGGLYSLEKAEEIITEIRVTAETVREIVDAIGEENMPGLPRGVTLWEKESLESLAAWQQGVRGVLTVLPKTRDTTRLINRELDTGYSLIRILAGDLRQIKADEEEASDGPEMFGRLGHKVNERINGEFMNRPAWFTIGTSLAFEAVILALACWIFVRRDF